MRILRHIGYATLNHGQVHTGFGISQQSQVVERAASLEHLQFNPFFF